MKKILIFAMVMVVLAACSTTENLPEGEQLYTGISEIAYNRKSKAPGRKQQADSTGVITAIAEAYNSVEDFLTGNMDANVVIQRLRKKAEDRELTREERDSLQRQIAIYEQAIQTASEEVEAALSYAPNNSIFGSSTARWPFPIGLWFYNGYVNKTSRFSRWIFDTFAATPRTITSANPRLRAQIAQTTLRNYGFFHGRVDYDVYPERRDTLKARIGYSVYPGPLHRLGTIEYQRFGHFTDSLIRATSHLSVIHQGDPFSAPQLDAERKRLSELFRNNGFYFFRPEFITFRADTIQQPLTAHLQVRPKPDLPQQMRNRYFMGKTTITVQPYGDYHVTDSMLTRDGNILRWSGGTQKPPLRYGAIRHNLFYERGSLYRQRLHEFIQSKVSGMGIFSNVQMNYTPRDTSATCDTLDVNILAILDKPYDSELEGRITNKSIGLLGPGLSWGMTKRNAFRGAENLSFKVHGSYEWQLNEESRDNLIGDESSILNSFELGATLSLTYPRLMPRFLGRMVNKSQRRQLEAGKTPRRALATTTFKLDATWLNRSAYFKMINFGGEITYTYQRNPWVRHELTPFRLEYKRMFEFTNRFAILALINPSMLVSTEDVIVPSIGYTFTYTPRARGRHNRLLMLTAKEAGLITNGIYGLAGEGLKTREKKLLGVPFAEFLKLTAEWHETWPITSGTDLAARVFLGAMWSWGNSTMAPFSEHFFSGGANSIRGFPVHGIGPGSFRLEEAAWRYVLQLGDLKLEANAEWRFPIFAGLKGALFLDAGNVWFLTPKEEIPGAAIDAETFFKEIALGTGVGLRYDLDFLVLRFDVGVALHAPYDTGKSGYFNIPRFKDALGFHLAVGYPF